MTHPLVWELTSVVEQEGFERYEEIVRFLVAGSRRVLLDEHDRLERELAARGRLADRDALLPFDPAEVLRKCLSTEFIDGSSGQIREHKTAERSAEARKRSEVVAELVSRFGENWRPRVDAELGDPEFESAVVQMARIEIDRIAKQRNLEQPADGWPEPQVLPTLWYSESFFAAKARFVFLDEKSELTGLRFIKRMPDLLDATHFRDAAYADVLVTDDESFATVAKAARVPLRTIDFATFAEELEA